MKAIPKFHVGDIVWVLYIDDLYYEWCRKQIKIEKIKIYEDEIEYNDFYEEKDCFFSEEEAIKETAKREGWYRKWK